MQSCPTILNIFWMHDVMANLIIANHIYKYIYIYGIGIVQKENTIVQHII